MSAEEPQPRGASCFTMPLDGGTWPQCPSNQEGERDGEEEVDGEERWQSKLPTTAGGSSDASDQSDADSPPPVVRRKVSFADAFGLDLVSVKEFVSQNAEEQVEDLLSRLDVDEYFLSCLFTSPSSPQALWERVEERKVALESIELLPGTTTLRGAVRVANLCFDKAVYVRTTYNSWASHFDLLAEYVPGSSDGDTDGFGFKLTLVPPFGPEGVRVEFCLRYETAVGEFWDSNDGMNYALYCRRREHSAGGSEEDKGSGREEEDEQPKEQKEAKVKLKNKRSCLKGASKKICPESDPVAGTVEIPDSFSHKALRAASRPVDTPSKHAGEERLQKTLADSRRSRRRARLAQVKDHFAQRQMEALLGHFGSGEKTSESPLIPAGSVEETWKSTSTGTGLLKDEGTDAGMDKAPVLTYHQIPLLSLSWDKNNGQKDSASSLDKQALCSGAAAQPQTEGAHYGLDHITRYRKLESCGGQNNSITAVEELSCPPPNTSSQFQPVGGQSDSAVHPSTSPMEPVQVAQRDAEMDVGARDAHRPLANQHMTLASDSGVNGEQECVQPVIEEPQADVGKRRPGLSRASRRAEVEPVTGAPSRPDNEPGAVTALPHTALAHLAGADQTPLCGASNGLQQVRRPWATADEPETETETETEAELESEAMAQEVVTADTGTLEPAAHAMTQAATEVSAQRMEQPLTQASQNKPQIDDVQTTEEPVIQVPENDPQTLAAQETEQVGMQAPEHEFMQSEERTGAQSSDKAEQRSTQPSTETATTQTTEPSIEAIEIAATKEATQGLMKQEEEAVTSPGVSEGGEGYTMAPAPPVETSGPPEPLGISAGGRVLPGSYEREGRGAGGPSVNSGTKVKGGESRDGSGRPAPGDDTLTFTDGSGTTARERGPPMRQREGEEEEGEEEEEVEMTVAGGAGEHPFNILNEREHKEAGEPSDTSDTIWQREEDLSREMSHFKAAGQDVSAISQTDRLKCEPSDYWTESYPAAEEAEDWKDEMEKCLGLGREQGSASEPALYEQFTKATKGLRKEWQFDSGKLTKGPGTMQDEKDLMENLRNSPDMPTVEEVEEEAGPVYSAKEFLDAPPEGCLEREFNEGMTVAMTNPLASLQFEQDTYVPVPNQTQTLSDSHSIQTTLDEEDLFLLRDMSPTCQEGAASWAKTRGVSPPPGDGHETADALRCRRSAQPLGGLQLPREEGEGHAQSSGVPASHRGPEVARPDPLPLWINGLRSLGPMSKAAVYSMLFAIFLLTAYVCDLPVCLAVYLVSLCWWWCHGDNEPLAGLKGLD